MIDRERNETKTASTADHDIGLRHGDCFRSTVVQMEKQSGQNDTLRTKYPRGKLGLVPRTVYGIALQEARESAVTRAGHRTMRSDIFSQGTR